MSLSNLALSGAQAATPLSQRALANAVEFIEEPWGLGVQLWPVQKVILKAHYGIALDDNPSNAFEVTDFRRQNARMMTEKQYLEFLYSEGRSNIKEVVPGHERREMVLSIGRRSGKCVTGDTLVLTDRGVYRIDELGDLAGPELQPLQVGVVQEGGVRSRTAYFYNSGVRKTYRYTTRCGYTLEGTDNHRVRVMTPEGRVDWKRLDEITPGDHIAVHRTSDLWAQDYVSTQPHLPTVGRKKIFYPAQLTEDWGLLLGYLVGDGSWTVRDCIEMTVEHGETWDELKELYTRLLGSYSVSMDTRTRSTGQLRFSSKGVRQFLHNLGFRYDLGRYDKAVPWAIFRSPRSVVRAFLQGLFETDGGVEAGGKVVAFSTASEQLAREVQVLLNNFGVVTRRSTKRVKGYDRDYHCLEVRGTRSRRLFAERIGFRSHKKNDPLLAALPLGSREGGDTESLPHQGAWVQRLLLSVPKSNRHTGQGWKRTVLRELLGNCCKPGSGEQLTRLRLPEVIATARQLGADPTVVAHWEELLRTDYFYDPVVSVTRGEQPVYDLNVPAGAAFVANGVTNHNTTISACIAAYETYKLISKGDPQAYYGLPAANMIQLISVATDRDQAGLLYQEVSSHFRNCSFFTPYTANNTMSYARFQTPMDVERYGRYSEDPSAKATLKVTFRSCIAKGLRGAGNIVVILDEVAHFTDKGQSGAEEVYNAVTPSTTAFTEKDPKNHRKPLRPQEPSEARILLISSPLGRQGLFYEMFQMGMRGGKVSENMLCIQAPTWEVNPTVPPAEFEKHYLKNAAVFYTEYGGEFTDRTRGWIEKGEDLLECVDRDARPVHRGLPRRSYFLGLDLGLVTDGTAVALGHLDEGRIVLDLVDQMKAGEGKYEGKTRLEFDDVADWVLELSRQFSIQEGMFDTWAGIPFEQALGKRGLHQMKATAMPKQLVSQMFQNFKDMMWDKKLVLYDWPRLPGAEHCAYLAELLELQATYHTKFITTVEAPRAEGKHDDMSDAIVRMVWLASNRLSKQAHLSGPVLGGLPGMPAGFSPGGVRRRLHQTGSVEARQVPRRLSPWVRGRR